MSLRAILWVMNDAPVENQSELAILYALADRASDDGTAAWPSQDWIAYRARCTARTVRTHLRNMEERGLIVRGNPRFVEHIRKDVRPIVWNLNLDMGRPENDDRKNLPPGSPASNDRKTKAERPEAQRQTTGNGFPTNRPEPPGTPREPSVQNDRFDDFWTTYPKKVGKGQARKAYTTAVKKVDAGTLMEKLELFKAHHEKLGTDKRYIPNASTWLNGERWDDELIESTNDSTPSVDEVLSWNVTPSINENQEVPF